MSRSRTRAVLRRWARLRACGEGPWVEARDRSLSSAIVCAVILVSVLPLVGHAEPPARRPNVVIFFTDDQGTLDANCYGSTDLYTPNIDRLAAQGVRFTQAYSHTVCCPARAMLMTGRYPQRSGITGWTQSDMKQAEKGRNMPLSERTLAEALQEAGYRTALFGKWHLGAHKDHGPTRQGFDEFVGLRGGFIDNYQHYALHGHGFHDLYQGTEEFFDKGTYFPDLITSRALAFFEANQQRPFFAYIALNIPHYPEQPDRKFDDRYADLPEPRRSYAKMVSTTDDRIGQMLTKLDQLGLTENTVIIFMSDNGHSTEDYAIRGENHASDIPKGTVYGANGGGGNTGKWIGSKGTFYEGGLRVPAIINCPAKLPSGVVRDQAVTAMDWYPTVLALCNVEVLVVELDGHNLLPVIHSADAQSPYATLHWEWAGKWAVRQGSWKLIGQGAKAARLVSLDDAEPERSNHLDTNPEIAERLYQLHTAWLSRVSIRE